MNVLLDDFVINESHHEYDGEQNQGRSTGSSVLRTVGVKFAVDIADHGVEAISLTCRTHVIAEDTDDAGVFLEATDKARDNDVSQHGGQQRNGDSGQNSEFGSAVDLSGIVVLLVDALQTAQQNQDLKGQRIPNDINDHYYHVCSVGGAGVDPVNGLSTEELNNVVDNAPGIGNGAALLQANDIKHGGEDHADGDRIGHIGQKENGLQGLLQGLDGVQRHSNQQRQNGGDGNGGDTQQCCVFQTLQEIFVLNNFGKVGDTKLKVDTVHPLVVTVAFHQRHSNGVDDGPYSKDKQQ